ncbi:MAG: hypothetical protein M1168_03190 [Candidatus Marsarchaeota archaeon]|nr:hypothetical protein [Candidatus Marsarchaeota archaeon]
MIDNETANKLKNTDIDRLSLNNSKDIINLIQINNQNSLNLIIDVEDIIYRIFNPLKIENKDKTKILIKRTIIIGNENSTVKANFYNRYSQLVDELCFERGDVILIKNILLDNKTNELKTIQKTVINKTKPTQYKAVRFDLLKGYEKNIDVIGKVIEIGPLKHNVINNTDLVSCYCILTDFTKQIFVSLFGSAALAITYNINLNDFIKIEFCNSGQKNNNIQIIANDYSRIFSNKNIKKLL